MTVAGIMLILIVRDRKDLATSIAPRGDGSPRSKKFVQPKCSVFKTILIVYRKSVNIYFPAYSSGIISYPVVTWATPRTVAATEQYFSWERLMACSIDFEVNPWPLRRYCR